MSDPTPARTHPRRPLDDADLTCDWTPYTRGGLMAYYECPDCLTRKHGLPPSRLCPDRVEVLRRGLARVIAERDAAMAALAAARIDGARGMRDAAEGVVNARLTLCRNGIERLYDADGDCDRPEDLRAARGRESLYERVIGEIRALDPATIGSGS